MILPEVPPALLSTIEHLTSKDSLARLAQLSEKWPRWRIDKADHKWLDLSGCEFIGTGGHEIAVFTFNRHLRLTALSGAESLPLWFAAGPHFSDRWHDAQGSPVTQMPVAGIVRGGIEPASITEPLKVLAVVSCSNGQFVYDETLRTLGIAAAESGGVGNSRFRCLHVSFQSLRSALVSALALPSPEIAPIAPSSDGAMVTLSLDDAMRWDDARRNLPEVECPTFGQGDHVVYSYTFAAFRQLASLAGEPFFPVKIGFTKVRPDEHRSACHAAMLRISGQVAFEEPVQLVALLRCENGNATEKDVHRFFKARRMRSPGREWFLTNADELAVVFEEFASRASSQS
jgi:hypothetical protein